MQTLKFVWRVLFECANHVNVSTKWNFVLYLRNKTEFSRHEYTTQWIYFLFIYSLFNEVINKSDASDGKLISVDNELERMWKEDVIAYR
jgi:hypothetical protein